MFSLDTMFDRVIGFADDVCLQSVEPKYKNIVITHGESPQDLEGLKGCLSKLHVEARTYLATMETAQAKLLSSEFG